MCVCVCVCVWTCGCECVPKGRLDQRDDVNVFDCELGHSFLFSTSGVSRCCALSTENSVQIRQLENDKVDCVNVSMFIVVVFLCLTHRSSFLV